MGLIKAAINSVSGVLADQWKEFFYCEAMPSDVLVQKGHRKTDGRSSNKKGDDNVISQGSGISVADGQCMIIVENGKILDVCAEPGEYTFNMSGEPTIFAGDLGTSIKETFASIGNRIAHGGQASTDTRVYYFNTKEIIGNKYGTPTPVPFRVVDQNIGLDIDVSIRCNGEYTYKIVDPLLFYTNVCGNVHEAYRRTEIDSTLKMELMTALQPAFAKISAMGIRYSALPGHTLEIADALNEVLSKKWTELRGIKISSFGVNSVTCSPEDEKMIKDLQRKAVMRDPSMAAATMMEAQSEAMKMAAKNSGGAMVGFANMNMAQQAGGFNANALYGMAAQQQQMAQQQMMQQAQQTAPAAGGWKCSCGATNTAKFCSECGSPKPASGDGWTCKCGAVNKGKFCAECGSPKPAGAPLYRCDKCGWEPEDPKNPPKFCPECGDRFDENDIV